MVKYIEEVLKHTKLSKLPTHNNRYSPNLAWTKAIVVIDKCGVKEYAIAKRGLKGEVSVICNFGLPIRFIYTEDIYPYELVDVRSINQREELAEGRKFMQVKARNYIFNVFSDIDNTITANKTFTELREFYIQMCVKYGKTLRHIDPHIKHINEQDPEKKLIGDTTRN